MVFPVGKVRGQILAHFHRQIRAGVGIKTSPVAQGFKIGQPDGKQLAALFLFLRLAGFADFGHHPFALDAVLGKHNQQPVVDLDGLKKLFVKFFAALEVFRRKPNPHARWLEDLLCPDEINGNQNALATGEGRRGKAAVGGRLAAVDARAVGADGLPGRSEFGATGGGAAVHDLCCPCQPVLLLTAPDDFGRPAGRTSSRFTAPLIRPSGETREERENAKEVVRVPLLRGGDAKRRAAN